MLRPNPVSCPHCKEIAPYGDERYVWISVHLESWIHRWWWRVKKAIKKS